MSDVVDFNCECADLPAYQTLAQLRRRMLVRGGYAAVADNPPPGVVTLIDEFLQGAQNGLYRDYAALHTERFFRWTMVPGTRYYGIADSDETGCARKLDAYKVSGVWLEDLGGQWYELGKGISPALYTQALTNTGYPCRYEIRQCIEVYPAPQSAFTLWVKGHFGLDPFTDPDDATTIDSELVFLLALGRLKQDRGKPDAGGVLKDADRYLQRLVAGSHGTARYVPPGYSTSRPFEMTRPLFLPVA